MTDTCTIYLKYVCARLEAELADIGVEKEVAVGFLAFGADV